jgi:hypothetical protein
MWTDRRYAGSEQVWLRPPKDAFMRVPDQVLKSSVFIGKDTANGIEYGGTGYIISVDYGPGYAFTTLGPKGIVGTTRYPLMFLATAAHVAEELEGFDFYIRANKKKGGSLIA